MAELDTSRRLIAFTLAIFLGTVLAAGCGGGGSGGDPEDSPEDLYVVSFSMPDFSGIYLNEQVQFKFSENVKRSSLNFDSIRIRTGPNGGVAPRGTFVRGTFTSGQVDSSKRNIVTFLPAVPNKVDLSDTGFAAASTYTVVVPSWPELNTVKNRGNEPMVKTFTSRFTTLPINAPSLFLDSDFPGNPDVVGITPANSADSVDVGTSVRITFSEPLLPGTVLPLDPLNPPIVLLNSDVQPPVIVPVSYFLAQTRDSVTVTLNPLSPLEEDRTYQIIVTSFVTDLVGNPLLTPYIASFSTGGEVPAPTAFNEPFDTNINENPTLTTANWNNRLSNFVGGKSGFLTGVFSPFAGDGADGALTLTPGQTLTLNTGTTTQRIWRYTSIDIQNGATLYVEGNFALVLQSQSTVSIGGTVLLNGGAGGLGTRGAGDQNESLNEAGDPTGGAGGVGVGGGWDGGDGGNAVTGSGGFLDGVDGLGTGGGRGGYHGDLQYVNADDLEDQWVNRQREGGGGAGHRDDGGNSLTAGSTGKGDGEGGYGGEAYGEDDFSDSGFKDGIAILTNTTGGSGGGGGGAEDDSGLYVNNIPLPGSGLGDGLAANDDEGGGGGGAGGGSLHILAYGNVSITGMILCNGGRGGDTEDHLGNVGQGDAGGGGSGGAIWVQSFAEVTLGSGAILQAVGGAGGNRASGRDGGTGAGGYIRVEDTDGTISGLTGADVVPTATTGTYSPSLSLSSVAYSNWFNARRDTPRYGVPTEIFDAHDGTVVIEYQATQEDRSTPGDDPDMDPEVMTEWYTGTLAGMEELSNNKWIRFRVRFSVPDDQPFADPLPEVDFIGIPVSF